MNRLNLLLLLLAFMALACQSTSTQTPAIAENKSTVAGINNAIGWSKEAHESYMKICKSAASQNTNIDAEKYCNCLVSVLQANGAAPNTTGTKLELMKEGIGKCALESKK